MKSPKQILVNFYHSLKAKSNQQKWESNWRKNNTHNHTTISKVYLPSSKDINDIVKVGNGTYGCINLKWFNNDDEYLEIGNYCSIADGVIFLTGGNHYLDRLSSYPFWVYYDMKEDFVTPTKGPIVVKDDVWIGANTIILSGVTVGQGAVIGAGSVVAKDIPPYAIFAGNRIIKYRFSEKTIHYMLQFDYSSLTCEDIVNNSGLFNSKLDLSFFNTEFYNQHKKQQ